MTVAANPDESARPTSDLVQAAKDLAPRLAERSEEAQHDETAADMPSPSHRDFSIADVTLSGAGPVAIVEIHRPP